MVNSKKKWNKYELDVRKKYNDIWFKSETSRYANRKRDDEKVDLVWTWKLNVQCKHYKTFSVSKAIWTIKEMPEEKDKINIAHIKITNKWAVVIISEDDWIKLVKNNLNIFK